MNSVSAPETLRRWPKAYVRNRRKALGLGVIVILSTVGIGAMLPENARSDHSPVRGYGSDGGREHRAGRMERCSGSEDAHHARLYLKVSGEFVEVAVQFPASRSGFTDLYIAPAGGSLSDLHASAKLGERQFDKHQWPEWSNWWNNQGWVAKRFASRFLREENLPRRERS